jgi:glycosyltransferase involved in cell wall biosynthesis
LGDGDKNELRKYLEFHYFTLPSKSETFGLVYVEALCKLPILFKMKG